MDGSEQSYDAILLVSFGGPEGPDDVLPFLENVVRGKGVPKERLVKVVAHYDNFGGKSPINDHCRELLRALRTELDAKGIGLPLYWGNRNWHPMLADTIEQMRDAGVKRALAFVTSAYSSYSGCRQYLENIEEARAEVGQDAPVIDKLRVFYNHPGFIAATADKLRLAMNELREDRRDDAHIAFTAHSIPLGMSSGCEYVSQLEETCRLVAEEVGHPHWKLVFQSRSGPPQMAWLEPDICDHLEVLSDRGVGDIVIAPIGFLSDHVEVLWDLDTEASEKAQELGLTMVRAETVGIHSDYISMIVELIEERLGLRQNRRAVGKNHASNDVCAPGCCNYQSKRPSNL